MFIEPNNTVLCMHSSFEHTDFTGMMDNEAMDIELNRLLSQVSLNDGISPFLLNNECECR